MCFEVNREGLPR